MILFFVEMIEQKEQFVLNVGTLDGLFVDFCKLVFLDRSRLISLGVSFFEDCLKQVFDLIC